MQWHNNGEQIMANQWFRLYAEFASDHKVQMMSEADQRRLVMLFCIRCNVSETLHDEELAFQLRVSLDEWMRTKAVFLDKGFIDNDNNILNWDKRQYVSDTSTDRVRKHREQVKRFSNVPVTPPEQIQNRTEQKQNRGTRLPKDWQPQDEHIEFCKKERPDLDPQTVGQRFKDYWVAQAGSKGVKLDWMATWRNWVRNEKQLTQAQQNNTGWRNDDGMILKKAASLNIYTTGKSKFEILAAIDRKEGRI